MVELTKLIQEMVWCKLSVKILKTEKKKIKIMQMRTLHDRFPDFDFGEDAPEDRNDSLQSCY